MGHLVSEKNNLDIRKTYKKGIANGWAGIFNRSDTTKIINITEAGLVLDKTKRYKLYNVWGDEDLKMKEIDSKAFISDNMFADEPYSPESTIYHNIYNTLNNSIESK